MYISWTCKNRAHLGAEWELSHFIWKKKKKKVPQSLFSRLSIGHHFFFSLFPSHSCLLSLRRSLAQTSALRPFSDDTCCTSVTPGRQNSPASNPGRRLVVEAAVEGAWPQVHRELPDVFPDDLIIGLRMIPLLNDSSEAQLSPHTQIDH